MLKGRYCFNADGGARCALACFATLRLSGVRLHILIRIRVTLSWTISYICALIVMTSMMEPRARVKGLLLWRSASFVTS